MTKKSEDQINEEFQQNPSCLDNTEELAKRIMQQLKEDEKLSLEELARKYNVWEDE